MMMATNKSKFPEQKYLLKEAYRKIQIISLIKYHRIHTKGRRRRENSCIEWYW